jgi:sulfoxide reductase heme-binding subunit YedZ
MWNRQRIAIRVAWTIGLVPTAGIAYRFATNALGANPIEEVTHETGQWALRLLVACLFVTPARKLFGWSWIAPVRKTLGLFAFYYAFLHFATYVALDLFFDFSLLGEDIAERPYITVGFATFCILCALAATSTKGSIKRLGKRWVTLHRMVYVAAIGGIVHFFWLVKADLREPLIYAAILAVPLALRVWWAAAKRTRRTPASS